MLRGWVNYFAAGHRMATETAMEATARVRGRTGGSKRRGRDGGERCESKHRFTREHDRLLSKVKSGIALQCSGDKPSGPITTASPPIVKLWAATLAALAAIAGSRSVKSTAFRMNVVNSQMFPHERPLTYCNICVISF
jgi:hypothetical protein